MLFLAGLIVCNLFIPSLTLNKDHSDDFYWRDYNGEVPKDALPGGMDRDHVPTYIGQVVASGVLVPGQIIGGVNKMYYYGDYSERVATENIKILCTTHPENFEWIKSNANDVRSLSRMQLIPGGFLSGEEVYIGRGIAENLLAVGKVVIPNGPRNAFLRPLLTEILIVQTNLKFLVTVYVIQIIHIIIMPKHVLVLRFYTF